MNNPFDKLSEISVDKPKTVIAIAIIGIFALSSFAQYIVFDNSEDAFWPENDTTSLLYEVEDTYNVDLDLVRSIVKFDGDLEEESTWIMLANVESQMLGYEELVPFHYGLFGGSPNTGPASSVMFWQQIQDPGSDTWSSGVEAALMNVVMSDDENLSSAVGTAMAAITSIPSVDYPDSTVLNQWSETSSVRGTPSEWQARMDSGDNNADTINNLIGMVSGLTDGRAIEQNMTIAPLQGQLMGALSPLNALQNLDMKSSMMSMFPTESRDDPWTLANMALITVAIDTKPSLHEVELETEVSVLVSDMTVDLETSLINSVNIEYSENDELTVFSFSRFAEEQALSLIHI